MFLANFTERILLDKDILMMPIKSPQKSNLMIHFVIEFLAKVCSPAKLEKYIIVKTKGKMARNSSNMGEYESYPFASSKSIS